MFWNYLIVGVRNAVRHKLYSFINVAGLAVALVCAILIGLYVQQELSFDSWLAGSERLYRIEITWNLPGQQPVNFGAAPIPLGPTMASEVPGVMEQTRIIRRSVTVEAAHEQYLEPANVVDKHFFTVIRLPLVKGDQATVLQRPDSVVLSETAVRKYFGAADPIGKTLLFDGKARTVTGVMANLPYNTQFAGDIFFPYQAAPPPTTQSSNPAQDETTHEWTNNPAWTYVRLAPGVDPHSIEAAVPQLFLRHLSPVMRQALATVVKTSMDKLVVATAVPLRDVHLTADLHSGMKPGASRSSVYGFAIIAGLILLIACVNFTNLATVRAFLRSREVGLRKVVGATRKQLVTQFLAESILSAAVALAFALAIVEILLPVYSGLLGHPVTFDYVRNWPFTIGTTLVALVCGTLGGFYPAIVLSGFKPAAALRPAAENPARAGILRTGLVVFQFAVSIGLGIAALVIFAQIDYARHIDLGFSRDNMVVISLDQAGLSPLAQASLMRTLSAAPDIAGAALSVKAPAESERQDEFNFAQIPGNPQKIAVQSISVSPEFAEVYGMKLIAGRLLSRDHGKDINGGTGLAGGTNIVIDEDAARAFGFTPQTAIGKSIDLVFAHVTIVGVVRNALFHGAQGVSTTASVYYYNPNHMRRLSIRVKGGHIPEALAFIDRTWRQFVPTSPISRWFLEDSFDSLYSDAERQGALLNAFVGIAILIACLGLFGLAAFVVERRTKEIGIRKVMGARTGDIVRLLLWQFSIPVLLANIIAWPVAWHYLERWLAGYAYRIELSPLYFIAAGLLALVIAWLTVIGHALRVARSNPVNALRYE
jgi:putative ABC transport system permease protein